LEIAGIPVGAGQLYGASLPVGIDLRDPVGHPAPRRLAVGARGAGQGGELRADAHRARRGLLDAGDAAIPSGAVRDLAQEGPDLLGGPGDPDARFEVHGGLPLRGRGGSGAGAPRPPEYIRPLAATLIRPPAGTRGRPRSIGLAR